MRVTMAEVERRLAEHEGDVVATIYTRSKPDLLVKHRVTKVPCPWPQGLLHYNAFLLSLGVSYKDVVNRKRELEGKPIGFVPRPLWVSREYPEGAGLRDTRFTVKHRGSGKRYFAGNADVRSFTGPSRYIDALTGQSVAVEEVKPYLPARKEQDVAWRVIDLDHVIAISFDCETFEVDQPAYEAVVP